jgi:hypothetical protein
VQRYVWEILGTETKGEILDIHCGCMAVIYAATVWWPRVKFKTCKAELSKLQWMAYLGITGTIRTTPTGATEVLLGLPSQHMQLEAEAKAGIYSQYLDRNCSKNENDSVVKHPLTVGVRATNHSEIAWIVHHLKPCKTAGPDTIRI